MATANGHESLRNKKKEILQNIAVDYKLDPFLVFHKLQVKNWIGFSFNYQEFCFFGHVTIQTGPHAFFLTFWL